MSTPPYQLNKTGTKIQKFWEELKNKKIVTTSCQCGLAHWPPRSFCPSCYSSNLEWVDLPLEGKLKTWTNVTAPPIGFKNNYNVGIIELDTPKLQLFGQIKNIDPKKIHTGLSLKIDFEMSEDSVYFFFQNPE
ncbi:MAG: Zn-ribbon domain-containing OB-fold protein [Candidatus Hodarchaeales archaeon]|jgi:uncharacterized OB-fold protein